MRLRHLCILISVPLCVAAAAVIWKHVESRPAAGTAEGVSSPRTEFAAAPRRSEPEASPAPAQGSESPAQGSESPAQGSESPAPGSGAVAEEAGASEARADLERGLEVRKQGRFDTAIAIFERALRKNPPVEWSSELLFEVGQTQYEIAKNRLDSGAAVQVAEPILRQALATFGSVIERYPSTKRAPSASYMTGSTYTLLDEPEKALESYQTAFDRYPDYVARSRALLRAGMVLAGLDRIPESLATFSRIAREFPDRPKDIEAARKYMHQLEIVGREATPLYARTWLNQVVDDEGLKSFQGEVIVLVFMASWCSSCSDAIPHLRRLIESWSSQGVVFLGALDPKDPLNTEAVDAYISRSGLPFLDVALVEDQRPWDAYQTDRLPAAVVIDRRGVIRWRGHPELFPSVLVRKALRGE